MGSENVITKWRKIALLPVSLYRRIVSPSLRPRCIYYPTCSEYFELSVLKYGVFKGSIKGFYRVLRCHPFAGGGYDPP
jgi:hypothetical protein